MIYDKIVASDIDLHKEVRLSHADRSPERLEQVAAQNKLSTEYTLVSAKDYLSEEEFQAGPFDGSETISDFFIAIVPIIGAMQRNASPYYVSTSTERTQDIIRSADENPEVHAIVLLINSGGGQVGGTYELAEVVKNTNKPILAAVEDRCGSAAYWVASQCDKIIATSPISAVGSIGAMTIHEDHSVRYENAGVKVTYITSTGSELKVSGNEAEPLTEQAKELIKARLNPINKEFKDHVSSGRGEAISSENEDTVFSAIMFSAKVAKSIGLVDTISTFEKACKTAHTMGRKFTREMAAQYKENKKKAKASSTSNLINNNMDNWFTQRLGISLASTEPVTLPAEVADATRKLIEKQTSEIEDMKATIKDLNAKLAAKEVVTEAPVVEEAKDDKYESLANELKELKEAIASAKTETVVTAEEVVEVEEVEEEVVETETNGLKEEVAKLTELVSKLMNATTTTEEVVEEVEETTEEVVEEVTEEVTETIEANENIDILAKLTQLQAQVDGLSDAKVELEKANAELVEEKDALSRAVRNRSRVSSPRKTTTVEVMETQEEEANDTKPSGRRGRKFYEQNKTLTTAGMVK